MIWKKLKDNKYYSVSNEGQVKRNEYTKVDSVGRVTTYKEKLLKPQEDKNGYYRVMIIVGRDKPKFCTIHRLVAEAFISNSKDLPCINHKDENQKNNNVENLEWCTYSYNNNYGTRQKRVRQTQGKKIMGYNDKEKLFFDSANQAERFFNNKNRSNIAQCANGKFKKMYGYEWRWTE